MHPYSASDHSTHLAPRGLWCEVLCITLASPLPPISQLKRSHSDLTTKKSRSYLATEEIQNDLRLNSGRPSAFSSLLSLQVLEGPWALSGVIRESMSLKYREAGTSTFRSLGTKGHVAFACHSGFRLLDNKGHVSIA